MGVIVSTATFFLLPLSILLPLLLPVAVDMKNNSTATKNCPLKYVTLSVTPCDL